LLSSCVAFLKLPLKSMTLPSKLYYASIPAIIFWDLTALNVITYQTIHQKSLLHRFIHHPTVINILWV
jgi:hypothetical protein